AMGAVTLSAIAIIGLLFDRAIDANAREVAAGCQAQVLSSEERIRGDIAKADEAIRHNKVLTAELRKASAAEAAAATVFVTHVETEAERVERALKAANAAPTNKVGVLARELGIVDDDK